MNWKYINTGENTGSFNMEILFFGCIGGTLTVFLLGQIKVRMK
jgi:hypothetical protein